MFKLGKMRKPTSSTLMEVAALAGNNFRTPEGEIVIQENPVSSWLFSNTKSAWIWLILRVYLGYSWLVAGWGKGNR